MSIESLHCFRHRMSAFHSYCLIWLHNSPKADSQAVHIYYNGKSPSRMSYGANTAARVWASFYPSLETMLSVKILGCPLPVCDLGQIKQLLRALIFPSEFQSSHAKKWVWEWQPQGVAVFVQRGVKFPWAYPWPTRSFAVSIRGRRAQFRNGELMGDEKAAEAGGSLPISLQGPSCKSVTNMSCSVC